MFYKGKQRHNPHSNAKPLTPEQIERALGGSVLVKPKPPLSAGALEAQQTIEKAKQLKGEAMPDLHTALSKALENSKREALNNTLKAWEEDEKETQLEKPMETGKKDIHAETDTVTRATYNYVVANPGKTLAEIKQALSQYNPASVGSLLTQFVFQNQIHRDAYGRHTAINKEYKPLMARTRWEKLNGVTREVKRRQRMTKKIQKVVEAKQKQDAKAAGIGALTIQEHKEVASILLTRNWTAQGVVDKLTVMQARQLYDLLKQIFGG